MTGAGVFVTLGLKGLPVRPPLDALTGAVAVACAFMASVSVRRFMPGRTAPRRLTARRDVCMACAGAITSVLVNLGGLA